MPGYQQNINCLALVFLFNTFWGDGFWVGFVPPAPALMTPAAGYMLVWREGNRTIRRYRNDDRHVDIIEGEWFTSEKITASDSGGVVYNAV